MFLRLCLDRATCTGTATMKVRSTCTIAFKPPSENAVWRRKVECSPIRTWWQSDFRQRRRGGSDPKCSSCAAPASHWWKHQTLTIQQVWSWEATTKSILDGIFHLSLSPDLGCLTLHATIFQLYMCPDLGQEVLHLQFNSNCYYDFMQSTLFHDKESTRKRKII